MPKAKNRKRAEKTIDQKMEQWHEQRYGAKRDKLSRRELVDLISRLCNFDESAAADLMLLVDEIERSRFETGALDSIVITVRDTAFSYTCESGDACEAMIKAMRAERRKAKHGTA